MIKLIVGTKGSGKTKAMIDQINDAVKTSKGNVVVEKSDGKTLYTQQLFWNARTKKIYSNVDSTWTSTRSPAARCCTALLPA